MASSVGRCLLTALRISMSSKALLTSKNSHRFELKNAKIFTRLLFSSSSVCAEEQSSNVDTDQSTPVDTEEKETDQMDLSDLPGDTGIIIQRYFDNAIAQEAFKMKQELLSELLEKYKSTNEISEDDQPDESYEEPVEKPIVYKEELVGYLAQKIRAHPESSVEVKLDGFEPEFNGTRVTLKKKIGDEIITIRSDVNKSLDDYDLYLVEPKYDVSKPKDGMTKAKPDFIVEIQKGEKIFSFWCTYVQPEEEDEYDNYKMTDKEEEEEQIKEEYREVFELSRMSLYDGEYKKRTYTVTKRLMDEYFYGLMMKYLEEKGITQEFAEKMVEFFTYHHYKEFLQFKKGIKSFIERSAADYN